MKAVTQVILESKECRALIARALDIPEEKVVSLKYNFAVDGYTAVEIAERLRASGVETE